MAEKNDMEYLFTILMCFLLMGCQPKSSGVENSMDVTSLSINDIPQRPASSVLPDSVSYICLSDSVPEALFKGIDKCLVHDGRIYIMDYLGTSSLTVFGLDGRFLFKVGKQGNGPGEYAKVTDFDVQGDRIYLLDTSSRRILVYSLDARFLTSYSYKDKLEGVEGLLVTDSCEFLLGMDVNLNASSQVLLTDTSFQVKKHVLSFDSRATRKHLHLSPFRRCGSRITYHYPVSDGVYLFDLSGRITHRYDIRWDHAVPETLLSDYESLSRSRKEGGVYSYFYETPFVSRNELISTVFHRSVKASLQMSLDGSFCSLYAYEPQSMVISLSRYNFPLYADDHIVVCSLNGMMERFLDASSRSRLDDAVRSFMEEGGTVLLVYHRPTVR